MQSRSNDLAMSRKLAYSHTHALIRLKLEIIEMDKEILDLEYTFEEKDSPFNYLLSGPPHTDDENLPHPKLVKKHRDKLKEYGEWENVVCKR